MENNFFSSHKEEARLKLAEAACLNQQLDQHLFLSLRGGQSNAQRIFKRRAI